MPRAVCSVLKQVPVVPWTIQVAALMTQGGGDIDDLGSLDNLATSTTTSSKTSVSFVSSSLTTGFSLMSLSDKSAVDVVRLGGRRWYMDDCATGSFCSSCAIPPRVAGGLWSDGVGCDACSFPFGVLCRGCG